MDVNKLIDKINIALKETDKLVNDSNFFKNDTEPIKSTKYVLNLLKQGASDYQNINIRILRAMHDLGMSSYKDFENTSLENALTDITTFLYNSIPVYKNLAPLRMDFGKGNPI